MARHNQHPPLISQVRFIIKLSENIDILILCSIVQKKTTKILLHAAGHVCDWSSGLYHIKWAYVIIIWKSSITELN